MVNVVVFADVEMFWLVDLLEGCLIGYHGSLYGDWLMELLFEICGVP